MKKRLLLVVLAVIAAMACTLFVGCADNSGAGESASDTQKDESVEKEEVTISLDKKDLVIDMYDEAELYAVVKNSDETVMWTSDNPSVATVSEGIVKGVAEGETVIRASVADKTAVCNVTVVKSSELPVLKLEYSEMNLYAGDVIDFEVFAKWKNKKVENAVYEWAVKAGGDVVSVENGEENGIFTLTALKAGVAEYTVSAAAVGATVYADVKFTVVMPDYSLEIKNFTATDDGYEYTLWRKTGEETPVTAETVVKRAGKEIDYAVISWKSSNEAVATAENGVITGKTDGKAVITATVSGRGIEPFSTEIDLIVKEEIYRKVTYYDSDKTTVLHEESVLDGTAAKYVHTVYPAESDLDDGYKALYNRCDWVNENGKAVSLEEVTSDLTVYGAYGYIAYKHYEFTTAADDNTVFNGPFAKQNKYAKIADGKLAMSFRAYADNTQVALMELVNWDTPLTMNCQKGVWYTFVIEFEKDETGVQEYTGVKAYILDENGNVIKQAAASLYDERTWAYAKLPYTTDESGAVIYGTECKIDVGVPMTGIKNTYTVTYYDEAGDEIQTEEVNEGGNASYVYEHSEDEKVLGNGYTLAYEGYKWVSELNGKTEVSLGEITEDMVVYLRKIYIAYTKAEKYDPTSGYKSVMSFNKYILADVNGNIEFKIRLNGTSGSSFILYEKHTWTDSEMSQWVDGNDWWTVTGDASTKTVTIYKPNGEVAASKVYNEYNAETLSIVLNCDVDIAAIDPKIKPLFDVTYYDVDGTTVLYTEKVEEGDKAVYAVPSKELEDGYVETYFNATWVTAHGGTEAADLTAVTENKSVYLSGEKVIVKSYEYTKQSDDGCGLNNKPWNIHKYAQIKEDKLELYVKVSDAYSKVGFIETKTWYNSVQEYLPAANEWYKVVVVFGDSVTCSVYNPDGSVRKNEVLPEATKDNINLLVYTQITDWSTPAFADSGSCEIAVKA